MAITRATNLAAVGSGLGDNPAQPVQVGAAVTIGGAAGIVTATTFSGNATGLSGEPAIVVDSVRASDESTFLSGLKVTGVTTSTTFSGNVTGTAATFSGNVTIGGVLTYDDVTNVDSLGIITARSDVSIADKIIHTGDTNTAIRFPAADTFTVETGGSERVRVDSNGRVAVNDTGNAGYTSFSPCIALGDSGDSKPGLVIRGSTSSVGDISFCDNSGAEGDDGVSEGLIRYDHSTDHMEFHTADSERFRITAGGGFHFTNGELIERVKITAGKLSDNTNIDLENGNVHHFTTQETTTSTPNIRVNSSTSLNSVMAIGDTISVTLITTAAAGGYSAQLTIDGSAVTEKWNGGSAPSAGGSSGNDVITYQIIKTADATYTVLGNVANFA